KIAPSSSRAQRIRQRPSCQPRNRAVRDIEGARNFARRLASVAALDCFFFLVRCEFRRSPHVNASRLRALAAFAGASADQLALELGKPAQDGEHKPPVRSRRVRPCVAKGTKARALLGDLRQRVGKVARRTRETIKARDNQGVAVAEST